MKKLLAIITSLCLLCTSLATGTVFADPDKVIVVPAVETKPTEGTVGKWENGSDDPQSTVVYDSTLPLDLGWGMNLQKNDGIGRYVCQYRGFWLDTQAKVDEYAGFMTYIKSSGPATDMTFHFAVNVLKADGTTEWRDVSHFDGSDEASFLRTDNIGAGWLTTGGGYYGTVLPSPIEGWLYVDFGSVRKGTNFLEPGDMITQIVLWDPGVNGVDNGSDQMVDSTSSVTVLASAPVLVEKSSVKDGKPVATTIALKGGNPDPNPDPKPVAPALPEYTGDIVEYANVDVSEVKTPYPHLPLVVGQKPETQQWYDYKENIDTQVITGKLAIQQIPMLLSHRATTNDGGMDELIGTYYTKFNENTALFPIESDKGVAYMFYIEVPDIDEEIPVRLNGAFIRDGKWTNVACYSGMVDIMSVAEDSWTTIPVNSYYFMLPSGFKGMVRFQYNNFGDEVGNLLDGKDGFDYSLASINFFVANMPGGEEQVVIGAPMVVTNLGNTGRAVYLNGDKTVARDMFTGAPLQSNEVKKSIQKGDFVTELPQGTLDAALTIGDVTSTVVPKWSKLEHGYRYQVELYMKGSKDGQKGYFLQELVSVYNKDRQQMTGILPDEEYALVVRAFDANGQMLGIYKPITFEAASIIDDNPGEDIPLIPDDSDNNQQGSEESVDNSVDTGVVDLTLLAVTLLVFALAIVVILGKRTEKN